MTTPADTFAVSFQPPPGYAGIPLHEDPGQRAAAIRQLVARRPSRPARLAAC